MHYWHNLPDEKRKWWILAAMTASISMIFIDITVLPVALPTISRELNISTFGLQWIINAYTLALTVLVLAGGRLADMWGLKKGFCVGLCLFALASALCGICSSAEWIIFNRVLQGVGGALMLPATQAIIINSFPPHQRGKAIGLFVSVGAIFLALGPMVGGGLTQYLSWRFVFWINLPIAALGMTMTLLTVPNYPRRREPFDMLGFLTLGMGTSFIITAVMNAQVWGWFSPLTLSLLVFGVLLIVILFRSERKISHPLVDLQLIRKKSFMAGSAAIFCNQFLMMITVFWTIYFQDVLNFSPSKAGMLAFLSTAPVLFAAPFAGFLVDRFGPRLPVMLGFSLIGFSLIWFLFHSSIITLPLLLPALIPFGFGVPLIYTPSSVSLMNGVPPEKRGMASGISTALRQFSATLGLAIFGTVFYQWDRWRFAKALRDNPATDQLDPQSFEGILSHKPSAIGALKQQSSSVSAFIYDSTIQSYVSAFDLINGIAAGCAIAGIVIAIKLMKNTPVEHPPI